jgi:hypothetical protein
MKFRLTHIILALFFLLSLTATQCEKDPPWEELPPETQTGANTFGALVNGELFVFPKRYLGFTPLTTNYNQETNRLDILSNISASKGAMRLFIDNPREGENILSVGYYSPEGGVFFPPPPIIKWEFACEDCGQVFITRFDTKNGIVSGTFEFSGRSANVRFDTLRENVIVQYTGDSIAHITEGRFDLQLRINN